MSGFQNELANNQENLQKIYSVFDDFFSFLWSIEKINAPFAVISNDYYQILTVYSQGLAITPLIPDI